MLKAALVQFFTAIGLSLWPQAKAGLARHRRIAAALFYLMLILSIVALFVGCMTGCSLVQQKLDPTVYYKRDIALKINGEKYFGVAVPPRAPEYRIKIRSGGGADVNMLTITTCHREITVEEPRSGWFRTNEYEWTYKPIKDLEDGMGCLLEIGAYNKQGRHSWATVDFLTGKETIGAHAECNGESWTAQGVSICQAKAGLLQRIRFERRVKVSPDPGCAPMRTKDELTYEYQITPGECAYYFGDKDGNFHRHTALGYQSILIREASK